MRAEFLGQIDTLYSSIIQKALSAPASCSDASGKEVRSSA
jgi:hypothetical protein